MTGLFEDEKRQDSWIEGRAIMLENDQEWEFPLPRIEFQLSLLDKSSVQTEASKDTSRKFSRKFFALQEQIQQAVETAGVEMTHLDFAQKVLPIAADLLRRNYVLADSEILSLLKVIPGDKRNLDMWVAIFQTAMGIGPKP